MDKIGQGVKSLILINCCLKEYKDLDGFQIEELTSFNCGDHGKDCDCGVDHHDYDGCNDDYEDCE